ncbi:MAG: Ig-like domain-containing protein, partial [Gemmatimonadota bacterium]
MPYSPTDRRFVVPVLLLVAAGGVALACGGEDSMGPGPGPGPAPVASVEVTPSSETLTAIGAQASFDATARDSAGNVVSGASISWSSSDQSVATVDGTGTVTAQGNGEATITASAGGESGTATVTVDQE